MQSTVSEAVLERFQQLTIWQKSGQRAPHKPLMLLIALGYLQRGQTDFSFAEIESQLVDLLTKYGPSRNRHKPEEPFWRLGRNERLFDLSNEHKCRVHADGGTNRSDLIKNNVVASFDPEVLTFFNEHPDSIHDVAIDLINGHFQPSFIEDLFDEVGLVVGLERPTRRGSRDPKFRQRVLRAYEDRCAVCGFHMVFGQRSIGVEAAHIKWHNAGGPDSEVNGLALCTLHHKLFDYGVFLVEPKTFRIRISDAVSCFNSAQEYVRSFHKKKILLPDNEAHVPDKQYLTWHEREVFKGEVRR
jgi:putative restriction endonuclease